MSEITIQEQKDKFFLEIEENGTIGDIISLRKAKRFFPQRAITNYLFSKRERRRRESLISDPAYDQLKDDDFIRLHPELICKIRLYVEDIKSRRRYKYKSYSLPRRSTICKYFRFFFFTVPNVRQMRKLYTRRSKRCEKTKTINKGKTNDEKKGEDSPLEVKDKEKIIALPVKVIRDLTAEKDLLRFYLYYAIENRDTPRAVQPRLFVPIADLFDENEIEIFFLIYSEKELESWGLLNYFLLVRSGLEQNPGPQVCSLCYSRSLTNPCERCNKNQRSTYETNMKEVRCTICFGRFGRTCYYRPIGQMARVSVMYWVKKYVTCSSCYYHYAPCAQMICELIERYLKFFREQEVVLDSKSYQLQNCKYEYNKIIEAETRSIAWNLHCQCYQYPHVVRVESDEIEIYFEHYSILVYQGDLFVLDNQSEEIKKESYEYVVERLEQLAIPTRQVERSFFYDWKDLLEHNLKKKNLEPMLASGPLIIWLVGDKRCIIQRTDNGLELCPLESYEYLRDGRT